MFVSRCKVDARENRMSLRIIDYRPAYDIQKREVKVFWPTNMIFIFNFYLRNCLEKDGGKLQQGSKALSFADALA